MVRARYTNGVQMVFTNRLDLAILARVARFAGAVMNRPDAGPDLPQGLINIAVTPFASDGAIDHRALEENVARVLAAGYDGVLIGGTYGEFATMTPPEREALFETAARSVAGRVPLLLCAAAPDLPTARRLARVAHALGGFPMLTPPYVSEVTDQQVESFFRDITSACSDRVIIYNAPGVAATLGVAQVVRLAAIPGIVGLKQGDLHPTVVDQLVGRIGDRIRLLAASDLAIAGPAGTGFHGLSSTNSCAFPELVGAIYRAFVSGAGDRGRDLNAAWFAYREFARSNGQPQTVKAAMTLRGWRGGTVRAPLCDLDDAARDALRRIVEDILAIPLPAVPARAGRQTSAILSENIS
jgi:4-hydroxy-tetrahydrodipicolinate synthase